MADMHAESLQQAILNALNSIDQRLTRIETLMRVQGYNLQPVQRVAPPPPPNAIPPNTIPKKSMSVSFAKMTPTPTPSVPPPNPHHSNVMQTSMSVPPPHQCPPTQQQQHQQQQAQHPQHLPQANPPAPQAPMLTAPPVPLLNPASASAFGPVAFRALEPPPQGYAITSRASMQEELDSWTLPRGYSMRIAGAKVTGRKKVRWVCFRGGEARHNRAPVDASVILAAKAQGRRKPTTDRQSKKCGCLFRFEVVETEEGSDMWTLHYHNEQHKEHNHPPSDQTSDPRARKLPAFMRGQVDYWLREGWQVGRIQEELKGRGFTNVLNTDLYNRKRILKREDEEKDGVGAEDGEMG